MYLEYLISMELDPKWNQRLILIYDFYVTGVQEHEKYKP